jgi:hypothetical protein
LKVQLVPKIAARLAPLREAQAKEQQVARAGRLERYRVQQSTSVPDRSSIAELEARLRGRSWADIAKKNGPKKSNSAVQPVVATM